jgi:hypothetical protein
MRNEGIAKHNEPPEVGGYGVATALFPRVPPVALVSLIETVPPVKPVGTLPKHPKQLTSHVPAVKERVMIFVTVVFVSETADPLPRVPTSCSPINPADGPVDLTIPVVTPPVCVVVLIILLVPKKFIPV